MSSPGVDVYFYLFTAYVLFFYCLCIYCFTSLNTILVVWFLVSRCLDAELIPLFIMLAGASARYPSTSPLQCELPATSCKEAMQTGVYTAGNAFNCFSKIWQRTYVRGPCVAFCLLLPAGSREELCNGFWDLTVRDFRALLRHSPHPFSLVVPESSQGGRRCRVGVFGWAALTWAVWSEHTVDNPNSGCDSSGFLLQVQSPQMKAGEQEKESTFIICYRVPMFPLMNLHWLLL